MLQDVEARRLTEVDYLNGGIVRFGREHGVPTPLNEAIVALIKGMEASWTAELDPPLRERPRRNGRARTRRADRLRAASTAASRARSPTSPASRSCTATPTSSCPPTASRRSSSRPRRATSASTARRSSSRSSTTGPASTSPRRPRDRGWRRIGVYGLDYIMTVRDFRALEGLDLVPFDAEFDLARAVKSDAELESVRESVRINEDGFEAFLAAYEPGKHRSRGDGAGGEALRRARLRPADDEHGPDRAGVRDRPQGDDAGRLRAPVARGRGPGNALGRGLARDRQDAARGRADGRGVRGVPRGGAHRDARRRDRSRRPSRGLEGLHRPRLPPRPRHRPLDRDDDDRAPAGGRGARDRPSLRDGALDAPACDRGRRARRACTCRTRGSSARTAASRSRACRCRCSPAARGGYSCRSRWPSSWRSNSSPQRAHSAGITRARIEQRLEQDDPENGVPRSELHGHTCKYRR